MSDRPPPTLAALFWGFLSIGIIGFGGVLPWARRMVVEQRGWLTPAEFTDLLGLCQFLPGPNIVNVAVALGSRFRGPLGAVAAVVGLLCLPMVLVVTLGAAYSAMRDQPVVARATAGLAAAASGLVVATALKIAAPLLGRKLGIAVALVVVVAIAGLHLPLVATLLLLAPVSMALHRLVPRR
ncbi:MAG: chromate transporter [Acetobacteraceae bacterium]|nr:chromate transporter [Acetobacteraceae bacterium]